MMSMDRYHKKKYSRLTGIMIALILIVLLGGITVAAVLLAQGRQEQNAAQGDQEQTQPVQPDEKQTEQETEQTATQLEQGDQEDQNEQDSQEQERQQLAADFAKEKQEWYLLLANVDNPLPEDFTVETEIVQNSYEMDARVAPIMRQMIDDAADDGVDLLVCSAYRSIEKQQGLFDDQMQIYLNQGMSEQEAYDLTASAIAVPGTSEHHTGLAADIVTPAHQTLDPQFADTDAGRWLQEHAWEYGFVLRYPEDKQEITKIIYESWHYRFVGKTHAKLMKESGLCLEEYLQQEVPEGYTGICDPFEQPQAS